MMQEVINYILKELGYIDCATRQLNRAMRAQTKFNGLMWITVTIIGAQTVATEFKVRNQAKRINELVKQLEETRNTKGD